MVSESRTNQYDLPLSTTVVESTSAQGVMGAGV
jgi:hypothetical protein